jgi:oxygen-independent coproporphyrinogen III oxidase
MFSLFSVTRNYHPENKISQTVFGSRTRALIKFFKVAGLYIHIPFCRQKCHYCNFFSLASTKRKDEFLVALEKEIDLQRNFLNQEVVETIYLGGGTPSLFSSGELNRVFEHLYKAFAIGQEVEITLEANPDDLDPPQLKALKSTPINRLSIGVQSFRDEDLHYLNRVHSAGQALNSIKDSLDAGFRNLSIDLIYGMPTLEDKQWAENLKVVASLDIPHLSAYALTVEPHTALDKLIARKKIIPPEDERMVSQFRMLMDFAKENRFEHYEISNLCRGSHYSHHNTSYWNGAKYLGLGPSAHSFNGISRQWNVASLSAYIDSLSTDVVPFESEALSVEQKYNEFVMLSLRTIWGVDPSGIRKLFGEEIESGFLAAIAPFIQTQKVKKTGSVYVLTDEGKLLADRIASDLFI